MEAGGKSKFDQFMEHHLREMASEDCVLSLGSSDPSYRTKQMASDDALDPGSRVSR